MGVMVLSNPGVQRHIIYIPKCNSNDYVLLTTPRLDENEPLKEEITYFSHTNRIKGR